MCEVEVKFSRYSVKNHLATHSTSIEEYEKRYGAPSDGQVELVQPSSGQSQSQHVPTNVAHPQRHIVPSTSQLPLINPEHASSHLPTVLLDPTQPVLDCGDSVHPVPPLHSVHVDLVPQHHADPEPSIFDLQSETALKSQMYIRPGMKYKVDFQ